MNSRPADSDSNRPATTDELLSHADWVRRLSRALLSDPNAAEDVAQDAWVAALKRPPTAGDGMRAWWARVVRSTASNHRRSEVRRTDREQRVASERAEATDPQVESTLEAHRRLATAIEALDEPLRAVIVAHFFRGASSREIAEREGVADSTIRTRLQKALEKLRRELDARAGGDRKAWAIMLAPLARLDTPAAASAVVIGGWIKIAAGLALLGLAGVAAHRFLESTHSQTTLDGSAPVIASAPAQDDIRIPGGAQQREEATASAPADAFPTPVAVPELVATVDVRVLDSRGLAIQGARLQLTDRSGTGECKDEDAPHGVTDSSGRVTLTIHSADRSQKRGRRAGLDSNTWDGSFAVSSRGYGTRNLSATLVLGKATSLGDVMLPEGADLKGRCVGSDGAPIAKAHAYLIHPDLSLAEREGARRGWFRSHDELASVLCSSDGTFVMHGVPPGTYRVRGFAKGLAQALSEPFTLAIGDEHDVPDLVLAECAEVIRGTLLLPDGSPCARGWIEYTRSDLGDWIDTGCTPDGSFQLDRSEATLVTICARDSRDEFGQVLLRGVRPGQSGLVLRLPPQRSIEVHVSDTSGVPIHDYFVEVHTLDDDTGRGEGVRSADGVGKIHALARPFSVRVESDGYAAEEQAPFQQDDAPRVLEFKLRPAALVHGRVLSNGVAKFDSPVKLYELRAEPRTRIDGMPDLQEHDFARVSYSDKDGAFSIGPPRDGRCALVATGRDGGIAFMRVLELTTASPVEGIVIDLADTGSIEGQVEGLDPEGKEPVRIMFSCGIGNPRFEDVDQEGNYHIQGLAPGPWWLRPTRRSHCEFELLPTGQTIDSANLKHVVVDPRSAARCDFDLRADEVRAIEGRVLLDGGSPRAWIVDVRGQSAYEYERSFAAMGSDGMFHLPVSNFGVQILSLRSPGTASRDDVIEARVIVPADGLHWDLTCDLGTLEVEGKPATQIQVLADLPNGSTWTTHAILDANGCATLDSLPAAKARVSVAGTKDSPVEVEIPARGRAQVRLP